jgi:hypothetical protein
MPQVGGFAPKRGKSGAVRILGKDRFQPAGHFFLCSCGAVFVPLSRPLSISTRVLRCLFSCQTFCRLMRFEKGISAPFDHPGPRFSPVETHGLMPNDNRGRGGPNQ